MPSRRMIESWTGVIIIEGLGWGLLVLHVLHSIGEEENLITFLYGIFIPLMFAIGIIVGGLWMWRNRNRDIDILRVSIWCLIGAVALGAAVGLTILYEQAEGVVMSDRRYVVAGQASIGGVIGLIIGIYENRQRRARSFAQALNQQLTILNRVLRHDIRNNANVIHGVAQLFAENPSNEEQADVIQEHALRLVELGDHARDMERLLRDGETATEPVDVVPIVQDALAQITTKGDDIDVRADLPESARIYAHPLIESALVNVIENAVEHNDKQQIKVSVDCSLVPQTNGQYTEITITDNGPGIPPDQVTVLNRGYETQLEHTLGVGLWLVHWLVDRSGGEIFFEENNPEGSIVSLRFKSAE